MAGRNAREVRASSTPTCSTCWRHSPRARTLRSGPRSPRHYSQPRAVGKLGGSPHVIHTRLESQALGALADSGLGQAKIYRLYPDVEPAAIEDALDLERQLAQNLRRPASAPAIAA